MIHPRVGAQLMCKLKASRKRLTAALFLTPEVIRDGHEQPQTPISIRNLFDSHAQTAWALLDCPDRFEELFGRRQGSS